MKFKSVLASLGACAIAFSAMTVSASAAIKNANEGDKYMFPIVAEEGTNLPEGTKLSDIYGFSCKLDKVPGEGENCIGAFCYQSDSHDWEQVEYGQEGADKPIVLGSDGTVKYKSDSALFAESDTWAKAFVAMWSWADDGQIDVNVSDFKLLDKDGNELKAAAAGDSQAESKAEESKAAESKAEESKAAESKAEVSKAADNGGAKTTGSNTGDAGVAAAVAGLALAGAAAFAARKKH